MNVLKQQLALRLTTVIFFTLLLCLGFYLLGFTAWAEGIRETVLAETPNDPKVPQEYVKTLLASMAKVCFLLGIPLLLTLGINRLRLIKQS